ncbi:MAG: histidinol-phosphate transaminase [Opitutales bacterium]|nr:histidinol-phosphate transaminase [Opitutales bacterium]
MAKFNLAKKISASVSKLSGYVPGEQPEGGGWVKLNTNEFPYPPSPKAARAVAAELGKDAAKLRLYPSPDSRGLRAAAAKYYGLKPEFAFAANGSDDALNLIIRAFADGEKSVATLEPSYSLYPVLSKMQGAKFVRIPFGKNLSIDVSKIASSGANLFFFTNPNAPTGFGFGREIVEEIASRFDGIVVVDEAYAPFSGATSAKLVEKFKNLIVVGTSSKGWGLAGMRIGWAFADPSIIEVLDRVRDSYNLDRLAQAAGAAAIGDEKYYAPLRAEIVSEREKVQEFFDSLGWRYFKSSSNFVFFKPSKNGKFGARAAADLFAYLKSKKILLRYFASDKSVSDGIRMTVGTPAQMEIFKKAALKWSKGK